MRGTPLQKTHRPRPTGIIPAYAGNTLSTKSGIDLCGDHPRVCGEHISSERLSIMQSGSSPRMRGTPRRCAMYGGTVRIIPAYAGNTMVVSRVFSFAWDHPRVCGEHIGYDSLDPGSMGSSPRMRGTHQVRSRRRDVAGIIPAYAGNTRGVSIICAIKRGSSPRMRGTLMAKLPLHGLDGIIPAYAGNTDDFHTQKARPWDHPRVCGEHRLICGASGFGSGSSPRMRGTPATDRQ